MEEDRWMTNKHSKDHYLLKKMQIKAIRRHDYTPDRMVKMKKADHLVLVRMRGNWSSYALMMRM